MTEAAFIPTAAFIEHFVLNEALENDVSLSEASKTVCPQFGVSDRVVFPLRQNRLLSLMYCLLVYPAEVWKRDELLDVVLERAKLNGHLHKTNTQFLTADMVRRPQKCSGSCACGIHW